MDDEDLGLIEVGPGDEGVGPDDLTVVDQGITHPPVLMSSLCVSYIAYDARQQMLYVWLWSSPNTYTYWPVPESVYWEFRDAPSKGWYFNRFIRNNPEYS